MDWTIVGTVAAILIAGVTLLTRLLDKSVSLREHSEYKEQQKSQDDLRDTAVELQTKNLQDGINRIEKNLQDGINRIEKKLNDLETANITRIEQRLENLEAAIRPDIKHRT
jgi:biopolymer transport protein ExbB/TolQ